MLWWGYFQKTKTVGKAEKREKTYAPSGECGNSTASVHGCFKAERLSLRFFLIKIKNLSEVHQLVSLFNIIVFFAKCGYDL